jgi:hypothetical protein
MKLEDILTLVKAGYTREEIDKLEKPEAPAKPASSTETPETPAPAATDTQPAKAPEEAPKPAPEAPKPAAPETNGNEQIMGAINALTAAIQKMNVQNASIPGGDDELTPEDMIANIINPPMKPKGGK